MGNVTESFSGDYGEAREKFVAAAEAAGAELISVPHPLQGPHGETLHIDFAALGPDNAENAIVIVSGTHGPEAFCGSGVQIQLLRSPSVLQNLNDTKLVLVHAHNPYGWAWTRRVNEDNVDLNRNYCDFEAPYPSNESYEVVRDLFLPDDFDDEARGAILAWIQEHGEKKFATVALSGQRIDPQGIFYGGHEPAWSHRTMQATLPRLLSKQTRVALLDFHTGVGEFGQGTILHVYDDHGHEAQCFHKWYDGKVAGQMEEVDYDEVDPKQTGALMAGFPRLLPGQETFALVVEYGTVGIQRVLFALIADNWLHAKGDVASEQARAIKQEMIDTLYGNTPEWHASVWKHGSWLIERTAAGLRTLSGEPN